MVSRSQLAPPPGPRGSGRGRRIGLGRQIGGGLLIAALAVLLCLFPKPENDLFFILRTGEDILRTGRLPHADTYSWVRRGTPWDVPEWLAFVLYALAFRAGGFFGTWLILAGLTVAAALLAWAWLARRTGHAGAFPLAALMLLGMKDTLQERPYAFTYPLLALSLTLVLRARARRLRLLRWLPPLCVLWTNLHQGVLVLPSLLLLFGAGDALTAGWLWVRERGAGPPDLLTEAGRAREQSARGRIQRQWRSAGGMLAAAAACAFAAMVSPYGWRVYGNVFVTLRDASLMANVTEWNSALTLPLLQLQPFLLTALVVFGAVALGRRRGLADVLVVLALFVEALLHAPNIALFAIGGLMVAAPHIPSALAEARRRLGFAPRSTPRPWLSLGFAPVLVAVVGLAAVLALRPALGPRGVTPEGIGEAVARVPEYPARACAFWESEQFPPNLRLLNDFETGGFLEWRLPRRPVFTDGRLDVYVGRAFDDMVTLSRAPGSPAWDALVQHYDFDCVLTANRRLAAAFAARPDWALVYEDPKADPKLSGRPRFRILLRRRPEFAALLARCARPAPHLKQRSRDL